MWAPLNILKPFNRTMNRANSLINIHIQSKWVCDFVVLFENVEYQY